jgi:hypothetical protein
MLSSSASPAICAHPDVSTFVRTRCLLAARLRGRSLILDTFSEPGVLLFCSSEDNFDCLRSQRFAGGMQIRCLRGTAERWPADFYAKM